MSENQEEISADEAGPVFEFEGDEISEFSTQIPSTKLEAPNAYPRGTILDLRLQVRVRSVRLDEGRGGALSRNHILAIEECEIVGVMTPAQRAGLLAQLQAQEAEEAAQAKETADAIPAVDPDDPEDWANLDDQQKNELRRQAVEDGVDEFEVHEPHPVDEPVQEGPVGISTAEAGGVLRDGGDPSQNADYAPGHEGLEVGVGDEEPGQHHDLAAVDPGF